MDSPTSGLDFAIIGHQDSWKSITSFINNLRKPDLKTLTTEQIKRVYTFIPPRDIYKITATSITGRQVNGLYIETFLEPDKLSPEYTRKNVSKVMKAVNLAIKMGAGVVTLGGFTSIVLEGKIAENCLSSTRFTTGNTLTAAFIVKGIERAANQLKLPINKANILIIGATGDIGLACVQYFKCKAKKLLLCARNTYRLQNLYHSLNEENVAVESSVCLDDLISDADIIIGVASSSNLNLARCKPSVLICDAGYPKNMDKAMEDQAGVYLFYGGMGQVTNGYTFAPDYTTENYLWPVPHVAYGCTLEALVLAFEGRYESYSVGKGNITVESMENVYELCRRHGIVLSPFFNLKGLVKLADGLAIKT